MRIAALAALFVASACTSVTNVYPPAPDGGTGSVGAAGPNDAGTEADAADAADAAPEASDAGSALPFRDIYALYFGPSGVASCTKNVGQCHGGPNEPGTASSMGFVCDPDARGCYTSLAQTMLIGLADPPLVRDMRTHPDSATLFARVTTDDYAAIQRWLDAGAPND